MGNPNKTKLTEEEKHGLTFEEIKKAERHLQKYKTYSAIQSPQDRNRIYELFLLEYSFEEMHDQYPQYSIPQIILTAALNKWGMDKDRISMTLRDRTQARVVRSVVEQVEFLSSMLSVTAVANNKAMQAYIKDPDNNPLPDFKINSIKEYKDVAETLQKLMNGVMKVEADNTSSAIARLNSTATKALKASKKKDTAPKKETTVADFINAELEEESE